MKRFLDTNVIVYAFDRHEANKRRSSRALLRRLGKDGTGVISTQVMLECFNALTRKLGIAETDARQALLLLQNFEVVDMTAELAREAIDCALLDRISIWDAGVVVAAAHARCPELLSEDLNAGQHIRGVKIVDPFTPED